MALRDSDLSPGVVLEDRLVPVDAGGRGGGVSHEGRRGLAELGCGRMGVYSKSKENPCQLIEIGSSFS